MNFCMDSMTYTQIYSSIYLNRVLHHNFLHNEDSPIQNNICLLDKLLNRECLNFNESTGDCIGGQTKQQQSRFCCTPSTCMWQNPTKENCMYSMGPHKSCWILKPGDKCTENLFDLGDQGRFCCPLYISGSDSPNGCWPRENTDENNNCIPNVFSSLPKR